MPKISQIDEVPCQAEVRILQKITLKQFKWHTFWWTPICNLLYYESGQFHLIASSQCRVVFSCQQNVITTYGGEGRSEKKGDI